MLTFLTPITKTALHKYITLTPKLRAYLLSSLHENAQKIFEDKWPQFQDNNFNE